MATSRPSCYQSEGFAEQVMGATAARQSPRYPRLTRQDKRATNGRTILFTRTAAEFRNPWIVSKKLDNPRHQRLLASGLLFPSQTITVPCATPTILPTSIFSNPRSSRFSLMWSPRVFNSRGYSGGAGLVGPQSDTTEWQRAPIDSLRHLRILPKTTDVPALLLFPALPALT